MKRIWVSGVLLVLALAASTPAFSQSRPMVDVGIPKVDFAAMPTDKPPPGFLLALTGDGLPVNWRVVPDASVQGGKVVAEISQDKSEYRFPLCILDGFSVRDIEMQVHFKPVAGKSDQAGGVVLRYQDSANYYVVRANALENNIRFDRFVRGNRTNLIERDVQVKAGRWHSLKIRAVANHFEVSYDGKLLFKLDDSTFGKPGRVGFWTKSDSVTYFADLQLTPAIGPK
ncbi:MAG TPA: family 16 glycoside hydrolase [Candidatus Cybelea sp.]|nr:family 16 glycoside hydrolase [Candidatus Cybelea sp.]